MPPCETFHMLTPQIDNMNKCELHVAQVGTRSEKHPSMTHHDTLTVYYKALSLNHLL